MCHLEDKIGRSSTFGKKLVAGLAPAEYIAYKYAFLERMVISENAST